MKTSLLQKLGKFATLSLFSALLFTSCGGDNSLDGTTDTRNFSAATIDEINNLSVQVQCFEGGTRVRTDFYTQNVGYNTTQVAGPFIQGSLSGTNSGDFIGVSAFGDIMVTSKMTNGSQVTGYNVAIFFCPAKNSYTGAEILGPSVQINNLVTDQMGIIINSNTTCASGSVDRAVTQVSSSGSMYPIDTVFTKYCQ